MSFDSVPKQQAVHYCRVEVIACLFRGPIVESCAFYIDITLVRVHAYLTTRNEF
jgi:hypothetical protein